jgi:ABC-type transport system involved in cytochrome bd biosynthesis fused ATPase/permease subunit
MARELLRDGLITEDTIKAALTQAKGDLFLSSCYLGVTARELDGYIRASDTLQGFVAAIAKVKQDPEYRKMSNEQFSDELERLTRAYHLEALEVIHGLAMESASSAAGKEVQLKAAIALMGSAPQKQADTSQMATLQELNQLYQQSAPRIKSVRIQTAQVEFHPQSTELADIQVLDQ